MSVCCSSYAMLLSFWALFFFFSSRRRHTRCALVTGVQTVCSSDLNSFNVVADEWLGKLEAEGRSPATLEKLRWLLGFARPLLGERPLGEITAPELLTVLPTVDVRGGYESAPRRRSTCGRIIRYDIAHRRAHGV